MKGDAEGGDRQHQRVADGRAEQAAAVPAFRRLTESWKGGPGSSTAMPTITGSVASRPSTISVLGRRKIQRTSARSSRAIGAAAGRAGLRPAGARSSVVVALPS